MLCSCFRSLYAVMLMKNRIVIPLMASSVLFGCQDSSQATSENGQKIEQLGSIKHKVIMAKWVGEYQGTTPCMGCMARCEECPGMAVDLVLNQDQTYILKRENLSGNEQQEIYTGQFRFNADQSTIELMQVQARHRMYINLDQQILEILEDQTGQLYASDDDFILEKRG